MVHERNYNIIRGEIWERLIFPKDRRTHRKRVPVQANASIKIGNVVYIIPVEITSEGGVLLSMTPNNTEWLTDGVYDWDLVVTVSRSALLTSTPLTQTLAVRGTITVTTVTNLTPMDSDGVAVPLVART